MDHVNLKLYQVFKRSFSRTKSTFSRLEQVPLMDLLTGGEFTLDEMNLEFISHFHLQVNPVLGVWISCLVQTLRLGISLWAELCRRCCFSTTLCNLLLIYA